MEIYSTEEQQIEAIKAWWKANGTGIVAGTLIGLAGLFGWRYYSDSRIAAVEEASQAYQQALEAGQPTARLGVVANEYADSAYARLAALNLAKRAVEGGQLAEAEAQLQSVLTDDGDGLLQSIAGLRLARVLKEQQRYDEALAVLAALTEPAFQGLVEELKGDIYVSQKQTGLARNAYQAAADAGALQGNPMLQMKLDDLAENTGVPNG